jgi:prephenate dehydrogenase
MEAKNISIVGTGLIGGSIALGLKGEFCRIVGFDRNPRTLDYAVKSGIIDFGVSIDNICDNSDIIIVAVPVDIALVIIPEILEKSNDSTIVIDVSSTKVPICNLLKNHPKRANFVAAHPMAGAEAGGPQNADAKLLHGHKVIICEPELSSAIAVTKSLQLFRTLGMSTEFMDADVHDSLVALVSHLPQMVSYGLARTIGAATSDDQWSTIAANGFNSTTRLAKSPSDIWMPILMQNKNHISSYLQLFIQEMEYLSYLLNTDNADGLNQFILQAQLVREKFENNININTKNNGNKSITRAEVNQFVATGIE